ncbi:hypothetical protein H0H92_003880 [Tricholoma furcatifolium]|nr:hypothetical protein H0H92_003880 [Tricholoma furcatifolium]
MNKPSQPTNATGSPRNKSSAKTSIRLSLGLASKALADVIHNKDSSKDSEKSARKAKETSSRRLSGVALKTATPRASLGDAKVPSLPSRVATPESRTVTRRRVSARLARTSMDDQPSKPLETVGRAPILRPRTANSGLPKYRPKSALIESTRRQSPVTGSRRPFSSSEDEKEDRSSPKSVVSSNEKVSRPISPLPQRAALRSNTRTVNATPVPTTPSKLPVTPTRSSPTRPAKFAKVVSPASAIPRPSSSTPSRSSNKTPNTPKNAGTPRRADSSRSSPSHPSQNESPLSRHSYLASSRGNSPTLHAVGNMSHISEGDSDESEQEDVALLLAPVASMAAPTPAMPRIQTTRRQRLVPQTPTRANFLPTRANMSYLSPPPPNSETKSSSLRPPPQGGEKNTRGSILSWEQLATEASRTLGQDDIEIMLSDFPAPFHPDAVSPTPSHAQLDIPESPCLSAMSSPGGYGSISQVLLPDVTPSPAVHHQQIARYDDISSDTSVGDAATVTLLRLQLAAAENTAKERLARIQSMEEEIHNLKKYRGREVMHLTEQVTILEQELKGSLEMRERTDEERIVYTKALEDQLQRGQAVLDQAVAAAVVRGQELARVACDTEMKSHRNSVMLACSARFVASEWASVRGLAEMELDVVRGEREVLSALLAQLVALSQSAL